MGKWPKLDRIDNRDGAAEPAAYEKELARLQDRLLEIQLAHIRTGGRAVIALEGWDAAGKGGLIQRLVYGLEPRSIFVWRIGAPSSDEKGRHHLWRFWQKLPAPGNWAVFDRTWYGRVLVERIEGYCDKAAWKRGYREIGEFERQLADDGVRIVKLLLHVSADEQKRRIVERMTKPRKRYKVGLDDFRNIEKRKAYLEAYDEMLEETHSATAPWQVIATDDKLQARLLGLRAVVDALGKGLDTAPPPLAPEVAEAARKLWGWKPAPERP